MAREMKDSGVEWIGEIPKEWEIIKLKKMMTFLNGYAFEGSRLSFEGKYPVIRIGDIFNNKIDTKNSNKINLTNDEEEALEKFLIKKNDILIAMSGATVGKLAFIDNIKEKAYINQRVGILKSNMNKYLFYSLSNNMFLKYIYLLSIGSAQPNISSMGIENYIIAIPTLEEQEKIVNYLDKKISDIDLIIEKTKTTIEDYKKYKQSIITEAVTKGLNPSVEMKDSGIEWIGQIPKHWKIKKLSQYFSQVKNKNSDLLERNLLSLSYGKIIRKDINKTDGLLPENFSGYNIIEKGDIVLRLTDLQNDHKSLRVGLCKEKGIITFAYITLRNKNNQETDYFYNYIHTFDIHKGFYGMGDGVRQGLTFEGLKKIKIVVPPLEEQQQIAEYLDKKVFEIDNLIAKKESLISEMEDYKKSLIYECVTGKKEIV